jgi:hypothetical protein
VDTHFGVRDRENATTGFDPRLALASRPVGLRLIITVGHSYYRLASFSRRQANPWAYGGDTIVEPPLPQPWIIHVRAGIEGDPEPVCSTVLETLEHNMTKVAHGRCEVVPIEPSERIPATATASEVVSLLCPVELDFCTTIVDMLEKRQPAQAVLLSRGVLRRLSIHSGELVFRGLLSCKSE